MTEIFSDVADFLGDAIQDLFSWVLGFLSDIFTGEALISFGRSIIGIFSNGSFDFSIKSLFELLFGVAFIIFAVKLIISIIRG
ncbi:MAG: hypothetical protein K5898_09175 [Ruminococcus sp.]|uniref:hypothetical protein n=1 Tax=Ruminococcus sp. TaxID=41978 RepID=UPI0025DDB150|nr:hypothetical protein [Ruminococcus sp.]MCR4795323.1 hypothetical protein [Ruminococcus sp.]